MKKSSQSLDRYIDLIYTIITVNKSPLKGGLTFFLFSLIGIFCSIIIRLNYQNKINLDFSITKSKVECILKIINSRMSCDDINIPSWNILKIGTISLMITAPFKEQVDNARKLNAKELTWSTFTQG